jgi:hypothetical protein
VLIYMGDYDSAAWLTRHVPKWWNDPAHGEILTTWAFNPNLKGRAPQVMHYVRTHQTEKDWFMSGDNGAGYLNPSMLFSPHRDSGLPDALDAWVRYNKPYFEQFDLSITGFVIDGHAPAMGDRGMNAYLRFSPGGIVGQKMPPQGVFQGEMPFIRMATDLTRGPEEEGERLAAMAGINRPKFLPVRTILWSPSRHKTLMETAMRHDDGIRFVDPFTFFALLKRHELNKAAGTVAVPPRNHAAFVAMRTRDGMTPLMVNDGPYRFEERSGRTALVQDAPAGTQYVYFETADALNRQLADGGKATVTVEILGTAAADLVIEYNGAEAAYQEGPAALLTGSGEWVELTYELPDAAFQHAQNSGADFRIVNPGVELVIHRVEAQLAE